MNFPRFLLFSAIAVFTGTLTALSLTVKPNVAPIVNNQISDQSIYAESTRIIDLSSAFSDPDASAAVRLTTPLGAMNFTLDGTTAPITVANFLFYVNSGRYFRVDPTNGQLATLFFHRSVANFVIQSGGFIGTVDPNGSGDALATEVLTSSPIPNEPFISNQRGTIAMAKVSGDPNSATSQWFINLKDNSGGSAALDTQNGGFTVFGRVASPSMAVVDTIAALPRYTFNPSFNELPLRDYSFADFTNGKKPKVPNLVSIPAFSQIFPLEFSASSNNAAVATATASGTDLLVRTQHVGTAKITVIATDLDGATVSQSFKVTVTDPSGRLLNISTRTNFPVGNEVLIAGFIVGGGDGKRLVVRAVGPSLANQGINALSDPVLEVHDSTGATVAQNDSWANDARGQLLSDLGFAPPAGQEAALILDTPPNPDNSAFTVVVRSATGAPGVGLVEVYDLQSGAGPVILNLSTRGEVGTGDSVLIGGLILRGSDSRRIVLRAVGPSLAQAGVAGVLPDPKLELRDSQGTVIDTNDNWQANPNAVEIQSRGFAPNDANESAIIINLGTGAYTAIISGAGASATGVALIEAYQVE